jgi:hypothetical protein
MTPADKYATAIHEAGHAVARHRLGYDFTEVTVVPGGGYLGILRVWPKGPHYSDAEIEAMAEAESDIYDFDIEDMDDDEFDDDGDTAEFRRRRQEYEKRYETHAEHANIISLAGPLAQALHLHCSLSKILENGGSIEHILDRRGLTSELKRKTAKLISKEWRKILLVASALMERPTLSYWDFLEVIFEPNWVAEDVALGIRDAPPRNMPLGRQHE